MQISKTPRSVPSLIKKNLNKVSLLHVKPPAHMWDKIAAKLDEQERLKVKTLQTKLQ